MTKVIFETGEITEIGSGLVHGKVHYHSHVLLKREDGQVVRLEDVAVDDYIGDALKVGSHCTIAFVHKNMKLPAQAGGQIVRNGILGVSSSSGYVSLKQRSESILPKVCLGIAALAVLLIFATRGGSHSTAWLFVGGSFAILFGLIGALNFNNAKNTNSVREEINRKFESLGGTPQASVVYG